MIKTIITIFLLIICPNLFAQLQVDENGWTILPEPSADSKIIYVSSSEGKDSNDGLSPEKPIKSIAKAVSFVRDKYPDRILFKRGDVWTPPKGLGSLKSGRSATEPLVLAYYGNEGDRPLFKLEGSFFYVNQADRSNIVFMGLEFYAYKHDPNSPNYNSNKGISAITWEAANGENILIEDCKFNYMQMGAYTSTNKVPLKNFKFRRNIILHSWAGDTYIVHKRWNRVQGMYVSGMDGILLEENLFDHNGWNEQIKNAGATMYNHNIYMSAKNLSPEKIIVTGNILARASAHGLQLRSGGIVEDNLFVQNAINLNIGYHVSASFPGAFGIARNNVFQECRLMDSLNSDYPRTATVRGIGEITIPATIENNIFSHCINPAFFAIDKYDEKWGFGGELVSNNNISYKWTSKIDTPDPDWFDPERKIAHYHQSLGKEASTVAFLLGARKRPIKTWWSDYSAYSVNEYIREGFEKNE